MIIQTGEKKWEWVSGHGKTGIYEICWQKVESKNLNRLALCMESRKVAVVDVTKIPSLYESTS